MRDDPQTGQQPQARVGRPAGPAPAGTLQPVVSRRGVRLRFLLPTLPVRAVLRVVGARSWTGADRLPRDGGFLLAVNHISAVDPLTLGDFLLSSGVEPAFLAKASLFEVPVLGPLMTRLGQVPVLRGTADARLALAAGEARVREGGCVVMYPDATITRDPELWPMVGKTGTARIALATGCPVVPVAQWGAHQLLPRGGRPQLWPRPRLRLVVGEPVDLTRWQGRALDVAALTEATDAIVDAVVALLEQLRGERAPGRWDPRTSARTPLP